MKMLSLLATTAALAIAVGGGASAQSVVDEDVEVLPPADVVVEDPAVVEAVVDETVVGRDLDGEIAPNERGADGLDNPDVIFYTMDGGGAPDMTVEQAADQVLERIDVAAQPPASKTPPKKN